MNLMEQKMKEAELRKVDAEIAKLIAESAKINQESRWHPVLIVTGMFTAIGGILMIISKLL